MDLVTGAMGILAPKLLDLLQHEYNLQAGLSNEVRSLAQELEHIDAFLRKVSEVPWDRLDEQVKVWAREAREASYGIEDAIDIFLLARGEDGDQGGGMLSRALKMVADLFVKAKPRRDIAVLVESIKKQLVEVAERRARYRIDDSLAKPVAPTSSAIDPRLAAMYHEVDQLIGIDESRNQVISMLYNGLLPDANNNSSIKKVSVVGVGGLGKTTLVKAVYEKLKNEFDCGAFVPVGRDPDLRVLFKDILLDLDKQYCKDLNMPIMEARHLINEIREFLKDKRYFIVIDDIWEKQSWQVINLIFVENNCGSRIITTTRNYEVAEETGEVYRLPSLSHDHSRKLFYTRIFGGEEKCPGVQSDEVSDKILKKCDGIPLAIITMASLLVGKPREVWSELYSDIGFGQHKDNTYVENTMRILSFGYYDLPPHLRTCLLYLSVFPEDHVIEKDPLIWKWIAEGFVYKKQGNGLFELGEQYFNDLINRSMIQAAESPGYGKAGCRVHDMVLDLIRSLTSHENSVTILDNNVEVILSQNKQVRRLACQKYDLELITPQADRVDMSVVRSYIASMCRINQHVPLLRFKLLRVLAIEGCSFKEGCHLEGLGDLLHLRYLSLRESNVSKLPVEIGNLKFLQTLDVSRSSIRELPASIVRLTQLVCLNCGSIERLPDGDWIGKLTSLEQLAVAFGLGIRVSDKYGFNVGRFVKELGSLRELRMLKIHFYFMDDSLQRYLAESLRSLDKIQRITLTAWVDDYDADIATWETIGSMLPQHLSHLSLHAFKFPRLPQWVNPSRFHHLSSLELTVVTMDEHDLKTLGSLTELRHLALHGMKATVTVSKINAGADGFFRKLRWLNVRCSWVQLQHEVEDSTFSFRLWNGIDPVPFESTRRNRCISVPSDTVMPNLQVLHTCVFVRALIKDGIGDCCSNVGLEYLTSLQKVIVDIRYQGASSAVVEVEAQLRCAIDIHPNRPTLEMYRMVLSDQNQESRDNSLPTEEEDDDYSNCNEEDDDNQHKDEEEDKDEEDDDNDQHKDEEEDKDEEEEGTIAKRRRTQAHSDEDD